ncbi:unnamed protein product [Adineta ricciae]|uniref:Uncharacterized protein n=1 Tax=Adineta ricciae TaxID=249248 RepID=A0A814NYJ0_ADIRI|nr:unnamed protein product [Adineta ricciae]
MCQDRIVTCYNHSRPPYIVFILAAIVIPSIVAREKRSLFGLMHDSDELDLKGRSMVRLDKSCNWYTYELDPTGNVFYDEKSYQCPSNTLASGYCILRWSDAVKECNSNANCTGYAMTDIANWHDLYDQGSEVAVQLYTSTLSPKNRPQEYSRWFVWRKTCWTFSAGPVSIDNTLENSVALLKPKASIILSFLTLVLGVTAL